MNNNYSGTYLLGGIAVGIESTYSEVHAMCMDYATSRQPELILRPTMADIEAEGRMSNEQREQEGLPQHQFSPSYLETLAVYRQLATAALHRGVMLLHGSVIAVDGEGYLFTARSGTGKSTHVRLWRELFGERAVMVNDDKPLVRIAEGAQPEVYGTPWDGKHHLSNNISVPLRAIIILERGAENSIHAVTAKDAFPTLLQQSFRPTDALHTVKALQLLSILSQQVGLFRLQCNMHPDAARVAYEGITTSSLAR